MYWQEKSKWSLAGQREGGYVQRIFHTERRGHQLSFGVGFDDIRQHRGRIAVVHPSRCSGWRRQLTKPNTHGGRSVTRRRHREWTF